MTEERDVAQLSGETLHEITTQLARIADSVDVLRRLQLEQIRVTRRLLVEATKVARAEGRE